MGDNFVIRGRKVKLLPTKEQEDAFWQFAGTRRFVYNWALRIATDTFIKTGKLPKAQDLQHLLVTEKHENSEMFWLNNISCDVGKQAIKDLYSAFGEYFKKTKQPNYKIYSDSKIKKSQMSGKPLTIYDRSGYPKFKKKLVCNEGFHQDTHHSIFEKNSIFIPKIGYVKIAKNGIFPEGHSGKDFKIYNAKVKFDGLDWYFVAGIEAPKKHKTGNRTEPIGIDLGIKDLAILSDRTIYKNINKTRKVKKLEKRKKRLQRKVSKKYKMNKTNNKVIKTKKSEKLQKQILKVTKRLDGIRMNKAHQVTSEIVKREPIFICMENLNVSGMMKNRHLSKSVQDQGFYRFRKYISYKCEEMDIPLYFVSRFYPSSKTCSCCGNIKKDLKLSDRLYTCPVCKLVIDRDINAAINIRNKGLELHEKSIKSIT